MSPFPLRLLAWVLATTAAVASVASLATFSENRQRLAEHAAERARLVAVAVAHRAGTTLRGVERATGTLASAVHHARPDGRALLATVQAILDAEPALDGAAVAYAPGAYAAGADLALAVAREGGAWTHVDLLEHAPGFRESTWYRTPALSGAPTWLEPVADERHAPPGVASYAVPAFEAREGGRRLAAVARADLALAPLAERLVAGAAALDPKAGLLVLSRAGWVIAAGGLATGPGEVPLPERAAAMGDEDLRELAARMMQGEEGATVLVGVDGQSRRWVHFVPLPAPGWSVAVSVDETDLLGPLRRSERRTMLFQALTLGLIALLFVLHVRRGVGSPPRRP